MVLAMTEYDTAPADDFVLISSGGSGIAILLYARCCTTLDDEAATARMNMVNPTGIDSPWRLCTEDNMQPITCADDAQRRHLMFSC